MNTTTTRDGTMSGTTSRPEAGGRRGIALLLVVTTLATATVLTTSFLVSRENTPELGESAQNRVTSEWSARSAAALVEAVMETSVEWRDAAAVGMLIDKLGLVGAEVSVVVTNLEGGPVGKDDKNVLMTVVASCGGVESVVQRIISETDAGTYEEALDPELKEFGVYASVELEIEPGSRIDAWKPSPAVRAGGVGKIGVGFTSAVSMTAPANTLPHNASTYLPPTATAGLETVMSGHKVNSETLPVAMWATTATLPATFGGLPSRALLPFPITVTNDKTLSGGNYWVPVTITGSSIVTLSEAEGPYFFSSDNHSGPALLVDNATLRISGNVQIAALDDFHFRDMAVEFEKDATLTVYHADDVMMADAIIGGDPALLGMSDRARKVSNTWTDPRRVRFVQLNVSPDVGEDSFVLDNASVLVGSVHAPYARVRVADESVIAGRVTAGELSVQDSSMVLLDPLFDNGMGLTAKKTSPLYDVNGDLVAGLKDAMEATAGTEGFDSALARLMVSLPPLPIPDNTPVDGATKRFAGTVAMHREWPVRVRLQEREVETALFEVPRDAAMASNLGTVVGDTLEVVISGTTQTVKEASAGVRELLSAVLGG